MKIRQDKAKKFHRKTHFLQISLLKFLYWRDTNLNTSLNEKRMTLNTECNLEKTVEQELLLVRNFLHFFNNNKFFLNKLSTNTFLEKNNQKEISNSSILATFFPQRQSFMYYWVLPFVGFVGLTYLNQNNQFKSYPSLELWPYLRKTVITEKKSIHLQNNTDIASTAHHHFSPNYEEKVFSLCWETLEYLNYKKCLYDQSKKYVDEIYTSEDNLSFVVKPNWIEHQKNQYSITFKDLNLSNHLAKNYSAPNDSEKKEIENLCKFYFYGTQDFIYSQLREKSSTQTSAGVYYLPNQLESKIGEAILPFIEIQNGINAVLSFDSTYNQNTQHPEKKDKGGILEKILAFNLWNRSSIFWYWYQINPSELKNPVISNDFFPFSKKHKDQNVESLSFYKTRRWQSLFGFSQQNLKTPSLNELWGIIRKKSATSKFSSQTSLIRRKINSLEKTWLNLDEFPKKIFPVTMSSNLSHQIALGASYKKLLGTLSKATKTIRDKRNIHTDEWIIHDEKNLTLGLFLNLNTQPLQSYQKASLLLDNFIKKLQLERTFYIKNQMLFDFAEQNQTQNSFNDRGIIKRKKDFASIIEKKLNAMHKLKYRQYISSLCFSPKRFHSNSLKTSYVPNSRQPSYDDSKLALSSRTNQMKFDEASYISNEAPVISRMHSKILDKENSNKIRVDAHSILSSVIESSASCELKIPMNPSAKKQISKDLQKIFCLKYLSFKTKKISKTNQKKVLGASCFNNEHNHFDVSKKKISDNENLVNQLKVLNSYRKFITYHINELIYSPYKVHNKITPKEKWESFKTSRLNTNQILCEVRNQHIGLKPLPQFKTINLKLGFGEANAKQKIDVSNNRKKSMNLDQSKRDNKIQSTTGDIYELSLLRQFKQRLKKIKYLSNGLDVKFVIDNLSSISLNQKKHDEINQNQIHISRVKSKIPRLSYDHQNLHLNDVFKKTKNTFLKKQSHIKTKMSRIKNDVPHITSYHAPNKLQNPLIMSGYEFPEFHTKNILQYKNKISKQYTEKSEKGQNMHTKLIVSLPPTFSKSIHSALNVIAFSKIKNDKKSITRQYETRDLFVNKTYHQHHNINIKKHNSFLFESYNDFFTLFKRNSISNLNSYWSVLGASDGQKNKIPSEIIMLCSANRSDIKPLDALSMKRQKDIMKEGLENNEKMAFKNAFFYHQKEWVDSAHNKINNFYEYFQQNLRSLFIKLNTLLKDVLSRIQHKLLDQHDFESYLTFDSLNESSKFNKAHNGKDSKKVASIFCFKTLKNFDEKKNRFRQNHELNESRIKSMAPKRLNIASSRMFKLAKTKKCLKNSVLFKNIEKRKIEKIFRTYLSCKSNEALLSHERTIAPNDITLFETKEMSRNKRISRHSINSYYITNALKRLQIRVKHNLLISKKNHLKKLFILSTAESTTNKKQESTEMTYNKDEIKEITRLFDRTRNKKNYAPNSNTMHVSDFLYADKPELEASNNKRISSHKHYSMKLYQISPNSLLKRLGFIFLNQSDKSFLKNNKSNDGYKNLAEPKKIKMQSQTNVSNDISPASISDLTLDNVTNKIPENLFQNDKIKNERYSTRHEKQKYSQKKRRRKKQKLENRRRKKRKRFYPRPKWLRFQLYNNFLKKRHFKHHVNCQFGDIKNIKGLNRAQLSRYNFHYAKITQMKHPNLLGALSNELGSPSSFHYFENKALNKLLKTKIYRQNKQQWGVSENPNFEKLTIKKMPLAWSLPIFANHELYQISNVVMSDFQRLCWKSYWLRSNLTPYIHRIQSSLKKLQLSQIHEQSSNTLKTFLLHLLGFNLPQISSHLFNNQTTNQLIQRNLLTLNSALDTTDARETINHETHAKQYDNHMSNSISSKMNKSSSFLTGKKSPQLVWYLNVRQSFQNRNAISNFSLFQNTQNIAEYNRILYERISDIIKNVRINLNVNGQNHARSFKRGRRKSAKTTTNVVNLWTRFGREFNPEIRAFSPFASTIDASIKPYGDLPTLRVLWALNKTNVLTFKQNNAVKKLWGTLKNREQNKSNKTKKFLSNSWKKIFPENFDKYCFRKAFFVEDKIRYSGFIKKDYESYLIRLKMKFKSIHFSTHSRNNDVYTYHSNNFKKQGLEKQNSYVPDNSVAIDASYTKQTYNDPLQPQKQIQNKCEAKAKRSMFFWWTSFSQSHKESIFMQQTSMLPNSSITQSSFLNFAVFSALWVCTILFHVCSLFFVLNIPEIRSLMKFNLLIFYKITSSYLIVIYSIYDLLKNYKNQIIYSFGFVYPHLINNTTQLFSRNTGITANNPKNIDLVWTHSAKIQRNKSYYASYKDNSKSAYKRDEKFSSLSQAKTSQMKKHTKQLSASLKQGFLLRKPSLAIIHKKTSIKYVHYGDEKKYYAFCSANPYKKIHYLSKNSTFLETTFRVPVQLHENSLCALLLGTLHETNGKNIKNHKAEPNRYSVDIILKNIIRRIAKIKALCDVMGLGTQNRITDKSSLVITNNHTNEADSVSNQNNTSQIPWQEKTSPTLSKEIMHNKHKLGTLSKQINTNQNPYTTQMSSYVLITELVSKKFQSLISLVLLRAAKFSIVVIDNCIQLCYKTLFKGIDILESVMLIIYKFLEKPAELMIDWIAQIFLVEWSSDIMTYLPEALDSSIWNSSVRLSRSSRIMGPIGFLLQRRLWCFMEIFIDFVSKPDADLLMRQKKGTIFWNIWAEILIQAAERYNINVQSLTTLKEEQELLIEKLLDDENIQNMADIKIGFGSANAKQMTERLSKTSMNKTHDEMIPLINMIENERPRNWWDSADTDNKSLHINNKNKSETLYMHLIKKNQEALRSKDKWGALRRQISPIVRFCHKGLLKDIKKIPKNNANASDIWRRWSTNQYFTYQGKDTDLFIDIHPPKGFRHISAIKYYQPAQQTLGTLVCQIYSGTFSKQVSKNILVVGAPGIGKSLLVQALAGETELKIITDNAHRYALVQRGVAIGMKLLRDVFDAIALHTPCLFLIEDIHVIGERRPMLISDDENAKATESFFASENEEVHEKNQLIYQLNKHAISHYKKPYKGDFSLLIPTNHFCFDLFLGVSPPKTRRSGITPKSPLDIESIEAELHKSQNEATSEQNFINTSVSRNKRFPFETLVSHLQIPSEKYFAPPPTSPFTILMMKEQKKLLPKKLVKQIPWSGLSWDQMMLVSKVNYSIRVKVALLADMAISNLSVKLDMITDLLVIMDSVRSNRGFVVFATTHAPFILDPALRRPGRLDETISLPSLPSLINRWEIFKTNLSSFTYTLDFVDYSLLSANLTDTQISNFISKTKLLLFNTTADMTPYKHKTNSEIKMSVRKHNMRQTNVIDLLLCGKSQRRFLPNTKQNSMRTFSATNSAHSKVSDKKTLISTSKVVVARATREKRNKKTNQKFNYAVNIDKTISSLNQAVKITMNADIIEPSQITKRIERALMKSNKNKNIRRLINNQNALAPPMPNKNSLLNKSNHKTHNHNNNQPNSLLTLLRSFDVYPAIQGGSSNLISLTYFQMGKFLINSQLLFDQTSYGRITWSKFLVSHNLEEHIFRDLYATRYDLKNVLMRLFSGKVGEFFIFNNSSLCRYFYSAHNKPTLHDSNSSPKKQKENLIHNGFQHSGFWNLVGIHPFWNSANSFVCSLMQKRYLYNKNLLISRMLYFEDLSTRRQPPSPPNSSILMPAKRYENLKRTENDFQQKATMSIHEKIQLHQQQRLMKKLYNQPVNEYFRSEMNTSQENRFTKFSSSIKELGYLNSFTRRPSSVNCYYKNRILIRHKFSLMNQWWNGQLAEHNAETTFLSDVDWRSIFNKSLGDLLIDFPDADQHYNPRHRRWFLQSSYWGYWNTFDKTMTEEISYHFMIQCFNKAYDFLNNEREILDYFAHSFLQKGILNEIHLVTTLSRFYHAPATVLK